MASPSVPLDPSALAAALDGLRDRPPLVQCLTNIVVAQWTANVLLAVGAAPAMVDNPHEAGPFAGAAGGVLVNLGTPQEPTVEAMTAAVLSAAEHGTPWVLDPVAAGGLGWRTGVAMDLLEHRPSIVRGNASEIMALAGGAGGKGVDATDSPEAALGSAEEVARRFHTVVAVSGPTDHLTDGDRTVRLRNGHPWMTQVTGVGCALGALMAAFAATGSEPLLAASAATAVLTVAAEQAAPLGRGPGTFAVQLLDQLASITSAEVADRVRLV
ncbi:hydroxyethylthiazole kinase [Curtobacterium sp. MCBD17_003]|uniref:hydroxyethylthiazole kinase n=1 Tax=Curtobacterium sp. MCBD17_003 TaxID=2175667 RepID=UPI000DA705FB|nr:hydroxyethylthiazole kinase [Curtobacterium sp. MCBD17_003]WIE55744.1 hydroxyethylthiazole kinase [Curtobacterium sp. MCBD17_003]